MKSPLARLVTNPPWTNPEWTLRLGSKEGKTRMEKTIYTREYTVVLRLLREARQEAGLTQTELAKKLKQSQSFVTKVERGDRRLDIIQLRTMCQTFGLTLAEFVSRLEKALRSPK